MAYSDDIVTDTSVYPKRKGYSKFSVLTAEGLLKSAYGVGQWVYYGKDNLIGKIASVCFRDGRPVLPLQDNGLGWDGQWEDGGFSYQIHQPNEFDSWDDVPEEAIHRPVCPAPAGDFNDLQQSYLEQLRLLGEIRKCFKKSKKEIPDDLYTALGFNSVWGKPKYMPGMHVRWQVEDIGGTAVIVGVERELDAEPGYWDYLLTSLSGTEVRREKVAEYRILEVLDNLTLEDVAFISE